MMLTLLPDLNIAALKYAHILKKDGGPLASATYRVISQGTESGRDLFEGLATLDPACGFLGQGPFYEQVHGSGLAHTKAEAIHNAISEAIELWALDSGLRDSAVCKELMLDPNSGLDGFTAFPGLGLQGAKKRALFSAATAWAIATWWEGWNPHLPIALDPISGIQIKSPIPAVATVLLWREQGGIMTYGAASSYNQASAVELAKLELKRNELVVRYFAPEPPAKLRLRDRRMRHFSAGPGLAAFREKVQRTGKSTAAPRLLVDTSFKGAWTQYAHVWRCVFDSALIHGKDKEDFFSL